jgi:hypothetical protein
MEIISPLGGFIFALRCILFDPATGLSGVLASLYDSGVSEFSSMIYGIKTNEGPKSSQIERDRQDARRDTIRALCLDVHLDIVHYPRAFCFTSELLQR